MSDTYVTLKIREALKAAQGNRAQAQRVLITWALDDEQLLRGLAKPFLKAIVGSAVDRVARGGGITTASPAPGQGIQRAAKPQPGPKKLSPQMLDAIISRMGTGGGDKPEPEPHDQADNLKALAAAFTQRKRP